MRTDHLQNGINAFTLGRNYVGLSDLLNVFRLILCMLGKIIAFKNYIERVSSHVHGHNSVQCIC